MKKHVGKKDNIIDRVYLCFFILLPFIYSNKIIDPVLIPRQIYLTAFVLIVCSITLFQIRRKENEEGFSFIKLFLPMLCGILLLVTVISFYKSIVISESIYVFSKLLIESCFFVITTYLIINNKLSIENLIRSVIIFCSINVIILIYQIFTIIISGDSIFSNIQSLRATYANKNLLSSILFLGLPFLLNSNLLSKPWKNITMILITLIIVLFWLIQTKAVIVALIVYCLVLLVLFFIYKGAGIRLKYLRTLMLIAGIVIVSALIVTIVYNQKFSQLWNRHTAITRLNIWENSLKMIENNYFFGVGAGNWQVQFPSYGLNNFDVKDIRDGMTTFQRPHNDFIWIFCEMGIIGFFAYILIFVTVYFYLFKLINISKEWDKKWLYISFIGAITGYIVIALADFPLERIEHQILFFTILSIITANYYNEIGRNTFLKPLKFKLPVLIILFIATITFSFTISINRLKGEYHTHKLYDAHHSANWNKMLIEAYKARNFSYSMDPMSAPIEWYKGVAYFSTGNISNAKESFEKAYQIHPFNIHVINNLASCYESMGEHLKAKELYLKALSISRGFEESLLNLSAVYYNLKDYQNAFKIIDKCDTNAEDNKYKTFLPSILYSYIKQIAEQHGDTDLIKKLNETIDVKENLVEKYFESKHKNISFENYLPKHF